MGSSGEKRSEQGDERSAQCSERLAPFMFAGLLAIVLSTLWNLHKDLWCRPSFSPLEHLQTNFGTLRSLFFLLLRDLASLFRSWNSWRAARWIRFSVDQNGSGSVWARAVGGDLLFVSFEPVFLFIYLVPSKMTHLCGSCFLLRFKQMIGCVLCVARGCATTVLGSPQLRENIHKVADLKQTWKGDNKST